MLSSLRSLSEPQPGKVVLHFQGRKMATNEIIPKQFRLTIGCLGLAIIAGTALTIFGVIFLLEGNASQSWPTVEGAVQSVRVKSHRSDRSNYQIPKPVNHSPIILLHWQKEFTA